MKPAPTRKSPRQTRSKETVEVLLTAAARILTTEGFEALTTNRVASVAGVSVGSLYQYFPNKEALVRALCERHTHGVRDRLRARFDEAWHGPHEALSRAVIHGMVEIRRHQPKLHQELLRLAPAVGGLQELHAVEQEIEALLTRYIASRPDEFGTADPALRAFLICHAVQACVHGAVLEKPEWLKKDAFVEELVGMVTRYLKGYRIERI
ncbi:MAG: TetR/AcrR family transcriptional regulator [Acidobacteria bacterium]|nr:TetR/AcrR family transcriptional regulator [Acidobacteriota bacterium]